MKIDIKKTNPNPKDKWEAIDFMIKAQQSVVDALHIMDCAIENNDLNSFTEKRMKIFIKKFE